jgi:hypothetical protein
MTPVDLQVLDGVELRGRVNVDDDGLIANIESSIRRGHPQVRPQAPQLEHVLLVGGGPSLVDTEQELVDAYMAGGKIFALNNSAAWCLERNLRPSAQIVLDARPSNARFIGEAVPNMRYLLASQCAPEVWDRVEGRGNVWIWHAVDEHETFKPILDAYYLGQWTPVGGGTTAAMRGLALLRTLGFVRFDLFGIDSCWLGGQHHAFDQPENARDQNITFRVHPTGHPEMARSFECAPWHAKQLEDFLQLIRVAGHQFQLNIHGDGLLAFALQCAADLEIVEVSR